jgi:polyphosphate glucokinase
VSGKGVELVITLGTGVGSALFLNGKLVPNLELGHHPFYDNQTYEDLLGKAALQKQGVVKWRANLKRAISLWRQTFNYNKLYLGGGYAQKIRFKLPHSVTISNNIEGILGGIKLWES